MLDLGGAMRKLICPLCLLFVLTIGFSGASAASEIIIPGLESDRIVEAWVDDELLVLKAANGRLYSVPLSSVELADFCFSPSSLDPSARVGPSLDDILGLIRAGVSETNIRTFIETSADPNWRLDLTADNLVALKQGGASEELIRYLLDFDSSRPRTTYIPWETPFSPRKDLPPEVTSQNTVSSADATVQDGMPYYPYVYPGYGYSCPSYPIYPVHPIEKPERPNRPTPRTFYRPRQPNPPVATPYSRTRSASRGNQLWIRWSLPRASGYARSHGTGQSTAPSHRSYGTSLTGSSRGGMRSLSGSSGTGNSRSMGSSSTGGAGSTGGRSFRGSSGSRSSGGARGAFSRARSNKR
jgi:hypothetical protein